MRLWHKDLIPALPDKQLQGQWRECCLIAKGLHDGNLNHLLVNKVKDYPVDQFVAYTHRVFAEMQRRGKNPMWGRFSKYMPFEAFVPRFSKLIFDGWHDDRYLRQCYYNLQEKYDCGGLSAGEWLMIQIACDSIIPIANL